MKDAAMFHPLLFSMVTYNNMTIAIALPVIVHIDTDMIVMMNGRIFYWSIGNLIYTLDWLMVGCWSLLYRNQ